MLMTLTADLGLPGVYFLPAPDRPAMDLPPLDTAAFVGYAARGPLDYPIAIEDLATFTAIFGGDLPLARKESGGIVYGNLPSAVKLFFANGGRRCYVVRVLGKKPTRTRFSLPGMVALSIEDSTSSQLTGVHAAWPGRWSERVKLATRLRWYPLDTATFTPGEAGQLIWQAGATLETLQPGDVLQITIDDQTWLAPITEITAGNGVFALSIPLAWELQSHPLTSPSSHFTSVRRLSLDGAESLDVTASLVDEPSGSEPSISLQLTGVDVALLKSGDVLWLSEEGSDWLVPTLNLSAVGFQASPPEGTVLVQSPHWLSLSAISLPGQPPDRVIRLRFDLLTRLEDHHQPALSSLVINQGTPHFWGEQVFLGTNSLQPVSSILDLRASQAADLYQALRSGKRLENEESLNLGPTMFSALLAPLEQAESALTYLPLGMLSVVLEEDFRQADPDKVGEDDLDFFDETHFFDQALIDLVGSSRVAGLRQMAFDRVYIQNRRLLGVHSLFFLDDVALVSLPDAVQIPWQPTSPPESAVVNPSDPEPYTGTEFLVCQLPPQAKHVQPAQGSILGGEAVTIKGQYFTNSEHTSVTFNGIPAGDVVVLDEGTLTCTVPPVAVPGPADVEVENWFGATTSSDLFTYVPAPLADLPLLDPLDSFDETPLRRIQRHLLTFCEARRDVVAILSLPAHYLPEDCLAWQENLRLEVGLPPWGYNPDTHDLADISFAAVYHPWLMITDETALKNMLRAVPPDGAVCGQIALREQRRQVWVAPANQPLDGVLGTEKTFLETDQLTLFQRNFNLIVQETGAFRCLSAHTQSDSRHWKQVSVRRLMILLRKIVLQRGMDYVFESNDERFRAGIQFALEELLLSMYERGAFSGRTQEQAFRVATGADVNPRPSIDQGRFVAQIQVAPAQPLEFITILLLRQGDRNLLAFEAG